MLQAYTKYKNYWLVINAGKYAPSLYWGKDDEEAFEKHINGMSNYKLMELLKDWEDR